MSARDLEALQEFMGDLLRRPSSLTHDLGMTQEAPRIAAGNDRLSPVEQLDIYREQFWLRHSDALAEDFPSLVHLLGEKAWGDLVVRYLESHPPDSFTLRDLGAKLPAFLAKTTPFAADPLLADLARVEWAFVDAFDAPDAPLLDPSKIARATEDDWARAVVVFQPSVERLALSYPADDYRAQVRAYRRALDAGETDVPEAPVRPERRPVYLVVYRGPDAMKYIQIEPLAFALMEKLARGEPLASACESLARDACVREADELESRVGGWFQQWASFGWISDVRFAESEPRPILS